MKLVFDAARGCREDLRILRESLCSPRGPELGDERGFLSEWILQVFQLGKLDNKQVRAFLANL